MFKKRKRKIAVVPCSDVLSLKLHGNLILEIMETGTIGVLKNRQRHPDYLILLITGRRGRGGSNKSDLICDKEQQQPVQNSTTVRLLAHHVVIIIIMIMHFI